MYHPGNNVQIPNLNYDPISKTKNKINVTQYPIHSETKRQDKIKITYLKSKVKGWRDIINECTRKKMGMETIYPKPKMGGGLIKS